MGLEFRSQAGFYRTAMHLLPWSLTDKIPFGEHFRMAVNRLERLAPILREHDVQLGLEFLGSFGNRRNAKYDFVHTIEGDTSETPILTLTLTL